MTIPKHAARYRLHPYPVSQFALFLAILVAVALMLAIMRSPVGARSEVDRETAPSSGMVSAPPATLLEDGIVETSSIQVEVDPVTGEVRVVFGPPPPAR